MRQDLIISKQHTLYQGEYTVYIYIYYLLSASNLASYKHMSNYTEAWLIKLIIKQDDFVSLLSPFSLSLFLFFLSLIYVCWRDGAPPTALSLIKSGVNNNGCRVAHVAWTQTWMRAVKGRAELLYARSLLRPEPWHAFNADTLLHKDGKEHGINMYYYTDICNICPAVLKLL